MNNPTQQQAPNIDFAATTSIEGFDGGKLFGQAFVLRKVSKFVVGGNEDAILPIPVLLLETDWEPHTVPKYNWRDYLLYNFTLPLCETK